MNISFDDKRFLFIFEGFEYFFYIENEKKESFFFHKFRLKKKTYDGRMQHFYCFKRYNISNENRQFERIICCFSENFVSSSRL